MGGSRLAQSPPPDQLYKTRQLRRHMLTSDFVKHRIGRRPPTEAGGGKRPFDDAPVPRRRLLLSCLVQLDWPAVSTLYQSAS